MTPAALATALVLLTGVWRWHDLWPPLGALQPAMLALGLGVLVLAFDRRAGAAVVAALRHPLARVLVALTLLAGLSVPTGIYPGHSLRYLILNLGPAVLGFLLVVAAIRTVGDAERLLAVQIVGCAAFAAVMVMRFDVGPGGRLSDLVFYDANDLGLLAACMLPAACYGLWRGGVRWRWGSMLGGGIMVAVVVRSGSRGAFLAVLAVGLVMLLTLRVVRPGTRVTLAIAAVVGFLVAAPPDYRASLATLLEPTEDYNWVSNSEAGRLAVWRRGVGYMLERPVLGVGLDGFPVAEGTLSPLADRQGYGVGIKWSAAHNSFVQVGAELGVPGLVLFVGTLAAAFTVCARAGGRRRTGDPRSAGLGQVHAAQLAGFVVGGFFLSQAYAPFLFALLGQVAGLDRVLTVAEAS